MSNEATSIAGDAKTPVVSPVVTESDLVAFLSEPAKAAEPEKADEAQTEEVVEEVATKSEDVEGVEAEAVSKEGTAPEAKTENDDVLSKFDLDKMSEAELNALAEKTRSKALSRFGELTADKKALQQQLTVMQQQLAQAQAQKPVIESKVQIPAEIASIGDVDGLKAKLTQADEVIEWAERVLDQSEHLGVNDIAIEYNGKEYTKLQIKDYMKDARRTKEKYIPAQLAEIQTKAAREQLHKQYMAQANAELPWVSGEDNDNRKTYEAISKNPAMQRIRDLVPEVAPELDYIIMHAINSMNSKKAEAAKVAEVKKVVKVTPPTRVSGSTPMRGEQEVKHLKELESRLTNGGSYQDLQAFFERQQNIKR